MINRIEYLILKTLVENPNCIGANDVSHHLKKKNGKPKYSDAVIKARISELKKYGFVTYPNENSNENKIWLKATDEGKAMVEEYKGKVVGQVLKIVAEKVLLPVAISAITALVTLKIKGV